jgi:eukaryotic-like serine/threonine-protein kinase
MATPLRIFISSPGDVALERRRAALVIEKLAKDYARFFEISPYVWETEPMLASGHFQDAILPPSQTDILVLILWARLGTPLPGQKYHGIDGRIPVTGTEWEFETALAANALRGVPDLLAYKKKTSPKAEYSSDADLEELRRQLQKLEAFWNRYFVDRGEFRAAFGEFEELDGFEAKLESDLRRLIERRIAAVQGDPDKATSPTWLMGSPFRGLETYRFEHAPIFFGRSEAIKIAVEHLVENAEAGRPFLLVLGASGAGKSSLAQAGIVPALGVRGVMAGVGKWRRAVIRPGGHPGGPFMALAAALGDDDALPELLGGQDVAALARHLEAAATDPAFPIVAALIAREQAARQKGELLSFEEVRLIVMVDQLEELFTLGEVPPDRRKAFILCLKGLMDSKKVLVIATMRSDYWHRAAEVPLLVALSEGYGRLDLLPPTQAEITEMIRRPAEVAGLRFEIEPRTEIGLDAALAEEASREPGALPLLSFLLDALYVGDVQGSHGLTLRYATMRTLGGLRGAIATRAEAAFTALPADAQAALPKVLRALVTVSRSGAEPTARAVPTARFVDGSPQRRVVEAFLDPQVRLLVADSDGEGARLRLAHEALISHWERAKRQIAQDRDDLRTRTVVDEALAEWRVAGGRRKRDYLLRDPYLANALDLARRWGDELDAPTRAFILSSQRRARLRQRLIAGAVAVFALVLLAAIVGERQAVVQHRRAERALSASTETANALVTDLAKKFRDRTGMPIDLVRDILDRAQNLQYQIINSGEAAPELRFSAAKALNELVLTLLAQGDKKAQADLGAARQAAQRFFDIMTEIAKTDPGNSEWQYELSLSANRVGDVLMLGSDFAGARDAFNQSLAIRQALAAKDPGNPAWKDALATSDDKIGDVLLKLGHPAEALDAYAKGLALRRELVGIEPGNLAWQRLLAVSWERNGIVLAALGDFVNALAADRASLAIRQRLATDQTNAQWRRELAISYELVGDVLGRTGQRDEALADYQASFAIRQRLAADDPNNTQLQRDLAVSYGRIGDALVAADHRIEGIDALRTDLALRQKLASEDPDNVLWQTDLVVALRKLALAGDDPAPRLAQALEIARRLDGEGKLGADQNGWIAALEKEFSAIGK